jgi:hypothetical protein
VRETINKTSTVWLMLPILEGDHTQDINSMLMLPILEGDHKQDINSMLMLPILEEDYKQDINSMANVTNILLMSCLWSPSGIGNISHTVDVLFMVSLKYW